MAFAVSISYLERDFQNEDLDALECIEEEAGDAFWNRGQLSVYGERLDVDFRVIVSSEDDGYPIGFYVIEHGDQVLYLCNIAVASSWRRRGVATFALESIETLARQLRYRKLALDVQEENLPAQLLYRKAGFRAVSILRQQYGDQDGYRMEKEIAG